MEMIRRQGVEPRKSNQEKRKEIRPTATLFWEPVTCDSSQTFATVVNWRVAVPTLRAITALGLGEANWTANALLWHED